MASVTIAGRLTADPELRFIPSGDAVASFTVAWTKRRFDRNTNTWADDGEPLFLDTVAWRQLGEGAAEKLKRGDSVVVIGTLRQRSWEKDGQKHKRIELVADEIGLSVRARKEPGAAAASSTQQDAPPW